jgi:hypothetical protein
MEEDTLMREDSHLDLSIPTKESEHENEDEHEHD